jgi:hypothetical protein
VAAATTTTTTIHFKKGRGSMKKIHNKKCMRVVGHGQFGGGSGYLEQVQ